MSWKGGETGKPSKSGLCMCPCFVKAFSLLIHLRSGYSSTALVCCALWICICIFFSPCRFHGLGSKTWPAGSTWKKNVQQVCVMNKSFIQTWIYDKKKKTTTWWQRKVIRTHKDLHKYTVYHQSNSETTHLKSKFTATSINKQQNKNKTRTTQNELIRTQ